MDILTPSRLGWAVGIVAATLITRFLAKMYYQRSLLKGLPQPPGSFLLGHLGAMAKVQMKQPSRAAPQTLPIFVRDEYDLPDAFYVDVWPMNDPILMILDADMMNQCTVKTSFPKHQAIDDFMQSFGGPGNLVSSDGAVWKQWRSAFNPGFSANHLMSLVPAIVDEVLVFHDIMTRLARSNELFRMEPITTKLTVDIIGKVVLDTAFNSQHKPHELVDAFTAQVKWQPVGAQFNPIELLDWPFRIPYQRYLTWKMDRWIGRCLEERFATRDTRGKSKAVVDLALEAYLKEVKGAKGDVSSTTSRNIDPEFKRAAINNIKTFIFAGHDTTSGTICYAYYYLSKNPSTLAKIRAEHDAVFGASTTAADVAAQLKADARLLNRLEYTLAVTREVLRIQPAASTIRKGMKGVFLHNPQTGEKLPTEGFMIWPVNVGVHRNARLWPEPHIFRPERHLHGGEGRDDSSNYNSKDAWIAFSKGPRNCIGQELAIIETKIILAMTVRDFDFREAFGELEMLKGDGAGYPSDSSGVQEQFGDTAYQIQRGAAKPREGMPCRISLAKRK